MIFFFNLHIDVLVWSNARVIRWANSIGLEDYADFLRESGVHGALIALDETFDVEQFAYFLQIPSTNEKVFQELFTTVHFSSVSSGNSEVKPVCLDDDTER